MGEGARERSQTDGMMSLAKSSPSSKARSRAKSEQAIQNRSAWDDRHHLLHSRDNPGRPLGEKDFFDRPRDLRVVLPVGHDGLSEPFERQPSLHFLHIRESPKMQRLRTQSG